MRDRDEMFAMVRDRYIAKRRRLAVGLAGVVVLLVAGVGAVTARQDTGSDQQVVTDATEDSEGKISAPDPTPSTSSTVPTSSSEPVETTAPDETTAPHGSAIVPDLIGKTTGQAFDLLRHAGFQGGALVQSRYIANESVATGTIAAQGVPAGTSVRSYSAVLIEVSAGGPAVKPTGLPRQARDHLARLAGFDPAEPVLIVDTTAGTAYKVDRWLFGPCAAVDEAYRTFADPQYGDSCY